MVRNVHTRRLPVPADRVGPLLDGLGGPEDLLWPSPAWPPMVLSGPLAVGAAGGHGPIRYRVSRHLPGRLVEFTFTPEVGLQGTHTFSVEPAGRDGCLLQHVIEGRPTGRMVLLWPLAVRRLHDAVLEDLLDRAEDLLGVGPARRARWSPAVRVLRRLAGPRAGATAVTASPLMADALSGADWSDAFAVRVRPPAPTDPQRWADAVFRDPPAWVRRLLVLRQALVGLVGIDRAGPSTFATARRTGDEVLLAADERHLDVRLSVRRLPDHVVLTTAVRAKNRRGRLYSTVVRRVHPVVVRAMLTRAARTLAAPTPTSTPPTTATPTATG